MIGDFKSSTPAILAALEKALRDEDYGVRMTAAGALVACGVAKGEGVNLLSPLLQDSKMSVQLVAASGIGKLEGEEEFAKRLGKEREGGVQSIVLHSALALVSKEYRKHLASLAAALTPTPPDIDHERACLAAIEALDFLISWSRSHADTFSRTDAYDLMERPLLQLAAALESSRKVNVSNNPWNFETTAYREIMDGRAARHVMG